MGLFSKKEKSVIPEAPKPEYGARSQSATAPSSGGSGKGKEDPLLAPAPERRYGREAPKYNPGGSSSNAGYGSYGNYGSGNAGNAAGYAAAAQPDARGELFRGARAPSSRTGAGFDEYAGGRGAAAGGSSGGYGQYSNTAGGGSSRPDFADDGDEDLNGNGRQRRDEQEGYGGQEQEQEGNEEEDEVEAIKQQIRFTKQESLATTRNAIRAARETEETATNTLTRLGEQTDRIANTELALDKAKGYNSRAADGAKDIRRLNQSIFRPTFQFNKQAKRDAQDAKILARHLEEKNDREEARQAAYSSRQRVEAGFREAERSTQKRQEGPTGRAKWEQGGRYQFEATNSDDELEQELDGNLDEIAAISGRLKVLATTAGKEIDAQNKHLDKIGTKVDTLDDKIVMNTQYMKRIK